MISSGSILVHFAEYKQHTFGAYDQSYTFAQPAAQTAKWS